MTQPFNPITEASIPRVLLNLTLPITLGIFGIMIFNIVDTYFIGRIGGEELAAVSFTFPVIIMIGSIGLGLGGAITAMSARAAGSGDSNEKKIITCSSLIIGMIVSVMLSIIGILTIEQLFNLLGADETMMPHIVTYMQIWYIGLIFYIIPMLIDHILRGLGNPSVPTKIMLGSVVLNCILDPLMIFGIGPFPEMGIAGAAWATVISRGIQLIIQLVILNKRYGLIDFSVLSLHDFKIKGKEIFSIGTPYTAIHMISPLGFGVFTAILSHYGNDVVAGYAVAVKIQGFTMTVTHALAITAAIFLGQNLGAQKYSRVRSGLKWLVCTTFAYCAVCAAILMPFGEQIGSQFTDSQTVVKTIGSYLLIVPLSYGFYASTHITASLLNVVQKPMLAGMLSVLQVIVINIPLAYILSPQWGSKGVFISILVAPTVTGIISLIITNKVSAECNDEESSEDSLICET